MKTSKLFSVTMLLYIWLIPVGEETMPSYPGGTEALIKFMASNITYPADARKAGVEGKVLVTFDVSKTGRVENVKVTEGIGSGCDAEAIRVIKLSKDWIPGTKDGETVRTQVTLPVMFKLDKATDSEESKDTQPSYPGGMEALGKVLGEHLKYPKEAHEKGIEGKVLVSMMVLEDGSLEDVHVVRGIGAGCDDEAIRVVNLTGKWNPGMLNGAASPMKVVLPITFSKSH